jgi:hypothetical protein
VVAPCRPARREWADLRGLAPGLATPANKEDASVTRMTGRKVTELMEAAKLSLEGFSPFPYRAY